MPPTVCQYLGAKSSKKMVFFSDTFNCRGAFLVVDSKMVVVNVTVWDGHTECYRGTCVRGDTKITFWHVLKRFTSSVLQIMSHGISPKISAHL